MFLTGGTALGAIYLGHRHSDDLDFFTRDRSTFDARVKDFQRWMASEGLSVTPGAAGPGFRRFVVSDGDETLPVDLVLDTAPAVAELTVTPEGLAIDSLDDITANKLNTILGRAEVRDYVDLYFLEKQGRDLLAFLPAAQRKDAGLDAATLAFILSEVKVNRIPADLEKVLTAEDLQRFIDDLRTRLARAAFPK